MDLVLGHTLTSVMPVESSNREAYMEGVREGRFFVILTAFDPIAYAKAKQANEAKGSHKRVDLGPGSGIGLWQTKMSIRTAGVAFSDVLDKMVKAGSPAFGMETENHPQLIPIVPGGHVEVGTDVVKSDASAGAPATPPPAK
jgi:hypothetical protein